VISWRERLLLKRGGNDCHDLSSEDHRLQPINLAQILAFLRRESRRLLIWSLSLAVAGYAIGFVMPKTFRATAVILPPEDDELTEALSFTRRGAISLNAFGRISSVFNQGDVALAILKSSSVRSRIVDQFRLVDVYHVKNGEDAAKRLEKRSVIKISNEGTISVAVKDRDRDRAAGLANSYVDQLDRFNREFRTFRARRTRQFLEYRVAQSDSILKSLERQLASYQKKKGALVLPPEMRGSADAAADLMARKAAAQVQLDLALDYASEQSEEVQRLRAVVRELSNQLGSFPTTQIGASDLVREAAVQQEVYALLTAQLEQSRIREAMDTPTIQVLDRAGPPIHPIWPRKSIVAGLGFVLGGLVGMADAFGRLPGLRRG